MNNRERSRLLIIGSLVMGAVYGLVGPDNIQLGGDLNRFATWLPFEAAAYAFLVTLAFRPMVWLRVIGVVAASALANFLLFLWWPISILPAGIIRALFRLEDGPLADFTDFGTLGIVGALMFCAILRFIGSINQVDGKAMIRCSALCFFAGLPFAAPFEIAESLAIHKTLWWLLFSVGLVCWQGSSREACVAA